MIPYADLAAALERKHANTNEGAAAAPQAHDAEPRPMDDPTLSGAQLDAPQEYEIGEELAEEEPA